ncbi:hypothetical protein [Companilactobacillus mishanensis]|uniref:Uncharacterized protein n=1 Tax=Companilactobacillus mishanensis TaxID=2486008 RepID=A0ABW9P811_9LACO|nr:hypothetical protein [Companilactobacillus mishanensis]MQS45297.1 hypothetical protein [Companilactobacillus mishanensis]
MKLLANIWFAILIFFIGFESNSRSLSFPVFMGIVIIAVIIYWIIQPEGFKKLKVRIRKGKSE